MAPLVAEAERAAAAPEETPPQQLGRGKRRHTENPSPPAKHCGSKTPERSLPSTATSPPACFSPCTRPAKARRVLAAELEAASASHQPPQAPINTAMSQCDLPQHPATMTEAVQLAAAASGRTMTGAARLPAEMQPRSAPMEDGSEEMPLVLELSESADLEGQADVAAGDAESAHIAESADALTMIQGYDSPPCRRQASASAACSLHADLQLPPSASRHHAVADCNLEGLADAAAHDGLFAVAPGAASLLMHASPAQPSYDPPAASPPHPASPSRSAAMLPSQLETCITIVLARSGKLSIRMAVEYLSAPR